MPRYYIGVQKYDDGGAFPSEQAFVECGEEEYLLIKIKIQHIEEIKKDTHDRTLRTFFEV